MTYVYTVNFTEASGIETPQEIRCEDQATFQDHWVFFNPGDYELIFRADSITSVHLDRED